MINDTSVSVSSADRGKAIARAKAEHYRKHIPIKQFLADLGYRVDPRSPEEQQFSCDLHGSEDRKPSARVYPSNNNWYCWGCHKARDHISTLRDKFGVDFSQACRKLDDTYEIPPFNPRFVGLSFDARMEIATEEEKVDLEEEAAREEYDRVAKRVERLLQIMTSERSLTLKQATALWASFDTVFWHMDNGGWAPSKGVRYLTKIHDKVMGIVEGDNNVTEGSRG